MKNLVATLLWSTFLAGCGGANGDHSGTGGMSSNAQLNGNWHATLTSTVSSNPLVEDFFIVQNGGTLSSDNVTLQGTCFPSGTMMGSVNGNQVKLILSSQAGDTVTITGTVSGDTLAGSYTIKTSGCISGDTGSLSATLIPSVQSSSYRSDPVDHVSPWPHHIHGQSCRGSSRENHRYAGVHRVDLLFSVDTVGPWHANRQHIDCGGYGG